MIQSTFTFFCIAAVDKDLGWVPWILLFLTGFIWFLFNATIWKRVQISLRIEHRTSEILKSLRGVTISRKTQSLPSMHLGILVNLAVTIPKFPCALFSWKFLMFISYWKSDDTHIVTELSIWLLEQHWLSGCILVISLLTSFLFYLISSLVLLLDRLTFQEVKIT